MAVIGALTTFTTGSNLVANLNTNFSAIRTAFNDTAVLTDTAKTMTVSLTVSTASTNYQITAASGGAPVAAGGSAYSIYASGNPTAAANSDLLAGVGIAVRSAVGGYTGVVTAGLYIFASSVSGTPATRAGIYINDLSGLAGTAKYAFYSAGNETSYFGGAITINAGGLTVTAGGITVTAGGISSASATVGIGYATGAGGTVTQSTDKSTGVTLSKVCGEITMNNAALNAATIVSFVATNTAIAAGDTLVLNHVSGGTIGSYTLNAACAAGSATIYVRNNTAGNLGEAIVIRYALVKGVTA